MAAKIPGLREAVEEMSARLGVCYKSAYSYYYRCKKYGVDWKTYPGGPIDGEPRKARIKSKESMDRKKVLKVRELDGTIKEYRTVLTLSEQKALLVGMILNSDTKDTDKLKALDMYNGISGNNDKIINNKICLEIKDWTEDPKEKK